MQPLPYGMLQRRDVAAAQAFAEHGATATKVRVSLAEGPKSDPRQRIIVVDTDSGQTIKRFRPSAIGQEVWRWLDVKFPNGCWVEGGFGSSFCLRWRHGYTLHDRKQMEMLARRDYPRVGDEGQTKAEGSEKKPKVVPPELGLL